MQTTIVTLNIGGTKFQTTSQTLTNNGPHFFSNLIDDRFSSFENTAVTTNNNTNSDTEIKEYFIDRDPTHFRYILNYLRNGGTCQLPSNSDILKELLEEACFYQIEGLIDKIKEELTELTSGNHNDERKFLSISRTTSTIEVTGGMPELHSKLSEHFKGSLSPFRNSYKIRTKTKNTFVNLLNWFADNYGYRVSSTNCSDNEEIYIMK
ncbi:hypothetical protein ABK040_001704 [Willaertia magna]